MLYVHVIILTIRFGIRCVKNMVFIWLRRRMWSLMEWVMASIPLPRIRSSSLHISRESAEPCSATSTIRQSSYGALEMRLVTDRTLPRLMRWLRRWMSQDRCIMKEVSIIRMERTVRTQMSHVRCISIMMIANAMLCLNRKSL